MLRRTPFKKKPRKKTDHPEHLAHLRTLPCCLAHWSNICKGPVAAHHSTAGLKGMGLRSSDLDAMPLCRKHHEELHGHMGYFAGWTKANRDSWQRSMSDRYRSATQAID